jgi:hypothetical protein
VLTSEPVCFFLNSQGLQCKLNDPTTKHLPKKIPQGPSYPLTLEFLLLIGAEKVYNPPTLELSFDEIVTSVFLRN